LVGSALTPDGYWPVHDAMNFNGAGNSLITTQSPAGQLDYLAFDGTTLVGSQMMTGSFANALPGGQAAADLFHV
jgi:hypothetical protein